MNNDKKPGIWYDHDSGFYWLKKPGGRWFLMIPQALPIKPSSNLIRLSEPRKLVKPDSRLSDKKTSEAISENT